MLISKGYRKLFFLPRVVAPILCICMRELPPRVVFFFAVATFLTWRCRNFSSIIAREQPHYLYRVSKSLSVIVFNALYTICRTRQTYYYAKWVNGRQTKSICIYGSYNSVAGGKGPSRVPTIYHKNTYARILTLCVHKTSWSWHHISRPATHIDRARTNIYTPSPLSLSLCMRNIRR